MSDDKIITYTLSLTVTRPIRIHDSDVCLADQTEWMCGREAKRELEKEVLQALRKLDGDCDIEVMEHAITDEELTPCRPEGRR